MTSEVWNVKNVSIFHLFKECNIFEELPSTDLPEVMEMTCTMMMNLSGVRTPEKMGVLHDLVRYMQCICCVTLQEQPE